MDSEKCWRRRLRGTTSRRSANAPAAPGAASLDYGRLRAPRAGAPACVAAVLLALPAAAETEPAVAALQEFLESVDTLTAEFEQRLYDDEDVLLEEADGTFALERPDRFVWHYRTPIEQVVLADGERLWMYDVELEQATVAPLEEEGAGSPAVLLSGRGSVLDSFEIEAAYALGGLDWVRLVPLEPGSDFSLVAIGFDVEGLPRQLEFVNSLNQTTRIEFMDVAVNERLDDDVFVLDLPDGVDVIGDDG